MTSNKDKIELAKLTKTIDEVDAAKFNIYRVNEQLLLSTSSKAAKRRLEIGKDQMFVVKNLEGEK